MTSFSSLLILLVIVPALSRSVVRNGINEKELIVERNVKEILPVGMNISAYRKSVLNYWTAERMASAKAMDLLMVENSSVLNSVKSPSGVKSVRGSVEVSIPGVRPKSLGASRSVVGKLYGRMGTSNYVCSGSVIACENGDTALTAGHCVWDTDDQIWATDILFVPAYESGSSPYGRWVWRTVAAMRGWTSNRDFNYDVAVLLLAPSESEEHIQDVTGSLGMTVNKERDAHTDAYGYPVNIHRGERLASCSDQAAAAHIPQDPSFEGMRLPCNMTGGSSGGPWTQDDTYQTSVNSFGFAGEKDAMYGPCFGDAVLALWERYQNQ